jgi:ABC-2 type transport system permease protein
MEETKVKTTRNSTLTGFMNLMRKELVFERSISSYLIQALIWILFMNGASLISLVTPSQAFDQTGIEKLAFGLLLFFQMGGFFQMLVIPLVTQGILIDEIQSGTAAWVLSKPIARSAFLYAKLISTFIALFIPMIIVPGIIGLWIFSNIFSMVNTVNYLLGIGVIILQMIFVLTLVIALSTFTTNRSIVLAVPIIMVLGAQLLKNYIPISLILPVDLGAIAAAVSVGTPIAFVQTPLIGAVILSIVCLMVAYYRFQREEL